MSDTPKGAIEGLTSEDVERLRTRMRGALNDTIAAAARRVAGTDDEFPGLNDERARAYAKTRDGRLMNSTIGAVVKGFAPIIQDLRERVAALEARPALRDAGVWSPDQTYRPGDVTTDHGSAWSAQAESKGVRPGDNNAACWRLLVKRGRDGRTK